MAWAHGTRRKSTKAKTTSKRHVWRGKPRRYESKLSPGAKRDAWQHKAQGR